MKKKIRQIDLSLDIDNLYKSKYVSCLILTKNNQILLQQRGENWDRYPGYLASFGGKIEKNESPQQALVRELKEELGGIVDLNHVITLGAITEEISNHRELIYTYFWHDKIGTITGCFEGEARYFLTRNDVLKHPKVMDDVAWLLTICYQNNIIK